jgi:hypothetical protein
MMPFIVATGTNTARIEAVMAMTARPISLVASRAARHGPLPIIRWRWMFSMTTMASSIRMPMLSVRASMVMLLNVKPMACMKPKVATTEVGSAMALMIVARQSCRKNRMISTVRMAPKSRSNFTSWIDAAMKRLLSMGTPTGHTLGELGLIFSSSALTFSATDTVFAPDCLRMTSDTALLPSTLDDDAGLFLAVLDAGDVRDADGHAARGREDEVAELFGRLDLALGLDRELLAADLRCGRRGPRGSASAGRCPRRRRSGRRP